MFSVRCRTLKQVVVCLSVRRTQSGPSTQSRAFSKPSFFKRAATFFFEKHLVLTNSLTSAAFMALGDMIHQEYEYQTNVITERYEWDRMKRMAIVGGVLGYMHHYYYQYLDVFIPKTSYKTVLMKVGLDQFFCAPLTIVCFFYIMGSLEGKHFEESTSELFHKFKMVYIGDWLFWPPVQCINFYFLPSHYRVFYINVATMVFDVFLSLMKHYDREIIK